MLLLFLLIHDFSPSEAVLCYSCSSTALDMRWPKQTETNKLLYLSEFPIYAHDNCDQVKYGLPVVECADSYCVKIVIKEPPAKREACVQGGAVVRDCWSRVMRNENGTAYSRRPQSKNNVIRMAANDTVDEAVGHIYTCDGFLCNHVPRASSSLSWCAIIVTAAATFLTSR